MSRLYTKKVKKLDFSADRYVGIHVAILHGTHPV